MVDKISNLGLILVILLLGFLLLNKGCSNLPFLNNVGTGTGAVIKSDTVYVNTTDTIKVTDTIVEIVPHYIDRVPNTGHSEPDINDDMQFFYDVNSNALDGTITVLSQEEPTNVSFDFKVYETTITDSIFITDSLYITITEKVRVNQVYFGGDAIVYPEFVGIFVGFDFISKQGWQIELGAGVVNKTPGFKIGFKKLITFRKNR